MQRIHNRRTLLALRRRLRREQTEVEKRIWKVLRNRRFMGLKFYRQFSIGPYVVDFYCQSLRLAIELDGNHLGWASQRYYDQRRTLYIERTGTQVVRFWNVDVMMSLPGVLQELSRIVEKKRKAMEKGKEFTIPAPAMCAFD